MNKKLEEKDFDIVPRLMEVRSFIFFSKEIQVYDVIPRKDFWKTGEITPIATEIYSFENAVFFIKNYIKYHNAPKYIIEKNGVGKYRYRRKSRFKDIHLPESVDSYYSASNYSASNYFESKDFDVYYDPPIHPRHIFSSIEEIKRYLLKIESENKWETIEEIYE